MSLNLQDVCCKNVQQRHGIQEAEKLSSPIFFCMVQLEDTSSNLAATTPSNLNVTSEFAGCLFPLWYMVWERDITLKFTNDRSRIIRVYHLRYYLMVRTWFRGNWKIRPAARTTARLVQDGQRVFPDREDTEWMALAVSGKALVLFLVHDHGLC